MFDFSKVNICQILPECYLKQNYLIELSTESPEILMLKKSWKSLQDVIGWQNISNFACNAKMFDDISDFAHKKNITQSAKVSFS